MARLVFFVLLILISNLFTQNIAEDLIKEIEQSKDKDKIQLLSQLILKDDLDQEQLPQFLEQLILLSEQYHDPTGRAFASYKMGYDALLNAQYDTAIGDLLSAADTFERIDSTRYLTKSWSYLAICYDRMGNHEEAYKYHQMIIPYHEKENNIQDLITAYNNLTMCLSRMEKYDEALANLQKAQELLENLPDKDSVNNIKRLSFTLNQIAAIHLRLKNPEKALSYLFEAKKIHQETGISQDNLLVNIGIAYQQMNEYELALDYYHQALKIAIDMNDEARIATIYNNIGYVYDLQKNWELTLSYYLKALEYKQKTNDNFGAANAAKNVGSIYFELSDYQNAAFYIDLSMEISQKYDLKRMIMENNYYYARIREATHDYQNALFFEKKYSAYRDSLFNSDMWEKISEMEAKYELEKNRKQTEILANNNLILQLQSEKLRMRAYLNLLLLLVLILILGIIIMLYIRKNTKAMLLENIKKQLEEQVKLRTEELDRVNQELRNEIQVRLKKESELKSSLDEKTVLLREIHHRVKNNLQVISSIISLQKNYPGIDDTAIRYLTNTQDRIYSMSLIHEKLYLEDNLARINFKSYVQEMVTYLLSNYQIASHKIKPDVRVDDFYMNVNTGIPCGMLINEIVTNSIKYAFPDGQKGTIFVEAQKDESGFITLIIGNDGESFDISFTENRGSIGLRLVQLLAKQLKAEWQCDTSAGAKYTFKFKEIR